MPFIVDCRATEDGDVNTGR